MDITELLAFSAKQGASDLHLSAGLPPMIRVDGDMRRINVPPLEHKQVHALIYDIMNDKQRKDFEEFLETDFSFEIPGVARFRVNAFNQNRGAAACSAPSLEGPDAGGPRNAPGLPRHRRCAARPGAGDRADGLR
jgi:twitching motility protein PilT